MDTESKTYVFGNEGNNGGGMVPAWTLFGNNGFGGGMNGGWGTGILGFLLGALIGNNGLFGGNGIGGNGIGAAGYLGNQMNNDNNTDLIMNAINGTDADVRLLATTLNADVNEVKSAICNIQGAIQNVGSQVGMSGLQVINAVQSGNASLASQLCQCCCENRLLTTEQGYQAQIRTIEQTNQLGSQADRNTASIVGAINSLQTNMTREFCDVKEREMQSKIDTQAEIITQLRNAADNANQTNQIIGYVSSVVTPLQREVDKIRENMPNTVPVQWPQLTAVNTTPYVSGGFYGNGWNGGWFGNGWNNGINF